MSYLDLINPVMYLYLNPELELLYNITTVEEVRDYYIDTGYNLDLKSNLDLPSDFNYKIYIQLNSSNIKLDIGDTIYNTYIDTNPQRLAEVHYTRYNTDLIYKYSIPSDFSIEVYKTFNDISLEYLMPSEYYLQYLAKSNNYTTGIESNIVMGTTSDFMLNILTSKFDTGFDINSDLNVTGKITSGNLIVTEGTITSLNVGTLVIDTLSVLNTTAIESLFQDGIILENDLLVSGTNSTFKSNVEINVLNVYQNNSSNLTVIDTTNLETLNVENISNFNSTANFNNGVNIKGGTVSFSNTIHIQDLIVDNTLQIINNSSFSNTVYFDSNITVNELATINDIYIKNNLEVVSDVAFSNNLSVSKSITAEEFITISDKRVKSNIVDYSIALASNIINNVKIKEYNLNNNNYKTLGIIAQELKNISSNLVRNTEFRKIDINDFLKINNNNHERPYKLNSYLKLTDNDLINFNYKNKDKDNDKDKDKNKDEDKDKDKDKECTERECKEKEYIGTIINCVDNSFDIKYDGDLLDCNSVYVNYVLLNNFLTVNYNELLMLSICCIQDLYNKI